jgi:hypothetical protein
MTILKKLIWMQGQFGIDNAQNCPLDRREKGRALKTYLLDDVVCRLDDDGLLCRVQVREVLQLIVATGVSAEEEHANPWDVVTQLLRLRGLRLKGSCTAVGQWQLFGLDISRLDPHPLAPIHGSIRCAVRRDHTEPLRL